MLVFMACNGNATRKYSVQNNHDFDTKNSSVVIPYSSNEFPTYFNIVDQDGQKIPYQLDDLNNDGIAEELFLQLSIPANSTTTLTVQETEKRPKFAHKTDVTMKVRNQKDLDNMQVSDDFESVNSYTEPSDLKPDNGLIFLEGPGWESDLVGYRIYFDDRNRIDIFGKSTTELALSKIKESYHERRSWGADILKVGSSLGIGTPALYKDGTFHVLEKTGTKKLEILTEGPLRSIFRITYPDWEVDNLKADAELIFEIHANHRYTNLTINTDFDDLEFATGLVTHPAIASLVEKTNSDFAYGYTWGQQTDQDETLGMAVLIPNKYNPSYKGEILETYTFSFNTMNSSASYSFLGAWELEPSNVRISNSSDFETYIEQVGKQWINPLTIIKNN